MQGSRHPRRTGIFGQITPAQFLVLVYALMLAIGTVVLGTDNATVGEPLRFIDAVFMAASALCVTGLSVVSIGSEFTLFGQLTVAVLIQIGALGVMTMSTLFAMMLGRRIGLRNRLYLQQDLNHDYLSGIVRLVRYVLFLTILVELVGAGLLFAAFYPAMEGTEAAYHAGFHAISAFGNAGFDLFGNSMEGFVGESFVLAVIAALFFLGGLGFPVLFEIMHSPKEPRVSLHTRVVLWSSALLTLAAWVAVLILEFNNGDTLGPLTLGEKLITSLFTAVTPRTAGFNVVNTAALWPPTLLFVMGLMFVGASPSSTGGGIKTTTFAALLFGVWSTVTGKQDVELGHRRIKQEQMVKAWTIAFLAAAWVLMITMALSISERASLVAITFEVVSAFGTVGLSMGVTEDLSSFGRVLLTVTMFVGRLGPMTLALALGQRSRKMGVTRLPEEPIGLG